MKSVRDGKRAIALFPLVLMAAAVLLFAYGGASTASAQSGSMLGIDVQPDTNTPASLGTLETCASHDVGDEFDVDIFVNNVSELRSWELRLQYDEDVLRIASVDFAHFLVSTPPVGSLLPNLHEYESPGRDFLATAETGTPDSGSGVLARLTIDAIGKGTSPIRVASSPTVLGARLLSTNGAIGDSNGDLIWDGSIIDSEVVVGGSCDSSPVVTPKPSPKPTPRASGSPAPGGTVAPTSTPGGPDDNDNSDDNDPQATAGGVVIVVPTGGGSAPGDDPNDPGAEPGVGSDDDNDGSVTGPGDEDDQLDPSSPGTGSDSSSGWLIVVGIAAAAFIGLGGAFYVMSRRMSP